MKACQQTRRTIERFFFSLNYDDADDRNQESDGVMISLEKFAYIHTLQYLVSIMCYVYIQPIHSSYSYIHYLLYLIHSTR